MIRSFLLAAVALAVLTATGCSNVHTRQTKVYQPGEKAVVDNLIYSVVDTQIAPRLGDDENPRIPQNRFYIVQLSVSSSGNKTLPIPAVTLVDDAGHTYNELADGSGVPRWLGVVRNVDPAQTEQGMVIFDAPSAHYKLRLTDEGDPDDVFVDLPLNFMHEQMSNAPVMTPDAPEPTPKK